MKFDCLGCMPLAIVSVSKRSRRRTVASSRYPKKVFILKKWDYKQDIPPSTETHGTHCNKMGETFYWPWRNSMEGWNAVSECYLVIRALRNHRLTEHSCCLDYLWTWAAYRQRLRHLPSLWLKRFPPKERSTIDSWTHHSSPNPQCMSMHAQFLYIEHW